MPHHLRMDIPQSDKAAGTPTVATLAKDTIVELVYDPDQRKTGLAVSRFGGLWNIEQAVRIHTGETLTAQP